MQMTKIIEPGTNVTQRAIVASRPPPGLGVVGSDVVGVVGNVGVVDWLVVSRFKILMPASSSFPVETTLAMSCAASCWVARISKA